MNNGSERSDAQMAEGAVTPGANASVQPISWEVNTHERLTAALASIRPDEAVLAVVGLMAKWHCEMYDAALVVATLPQEIAAPVVAVMLQAATTAAGLIRGMYPGDLLSELAEQLDSADSREAFAEMSHDFDLASMAAASEDDPFADLLVLDEEPEVVVP
jgi:hypothetical protein